MPLKQTTALHFISFDKKAVTVLLVLVPRVPVLLRSNVYEDMATRSGLVAWSCWSRSGVHKESVPTEAKRNALKPLYNNDNNNNEL